MVRIRIEMSDGDEAPRVIEQIIPDLGEDATHDELQDLFLNCLRGLSYVLKYEIEQDDDDSETYENIIGCCACEKYQSEACNACEYYSDYTKGCPKNCESCELYSDNDSAVNYELCDEDLERRLQLRENYMNIFRKEEIKE